MTAEFRFYDRLNDFLPFARRQCATAREVSERNTVKDVIEGLGVPHAEIALLLANGEPVDFSYVVRDGDRISAFPSFHTLTPDSPLPDQPPAPLRFVLDVHLGRLAAYLRLLGFDTLYRNHHEDRDLAYVSQHDNRVLLTRDVGLLKRNAVRYGYYLRATQPQEQLMEVAGRYRLQDHSQPFQRCLHCNGLLQIVEKSSVAEQLPPRTRRYYNKFRQCRTCGRVYWKGSHYQRMTDFLVQRFQPG